MNKQLLAFALLFTLTLTQFTNPGCSSFNTNNNCISCINRYYLLSGICFPVSPLCLTYDQTSGQCLTCYSGFMLNQGNCLPVPKISNCLTYSSTGSCTVCSSGYYLMNNTCQQISPLCQTFNATTGICLSCLPNYSLNNGTCSPTLIVNCQTQLLITCQICSTGYYL